MVVKKMATPIDDSFWDNYLEISRSTALHKYLPPTEQTSAVIIVAIYARVSTEEQEEGYSIDQQIRECREFVESQGWRVYRVYVDVGYTGTNADRPDFQKMLRDAKKGHFQAIVVHKIDRTYRNAYGMLKTYREWRKMNILFASVVERIDFSTPWGILILGVLALLAEVFVENLRQETKKGLKGRHKGRIHNGPLPFGYCSGHCQTCTDVNGQGYCPRYGEENIHSGKHGVQHPVDAQAVRYAFEQYCTGNFSDKEIAALLNNFRVTLPDGNLMQVRSRGKQGKGPNAFSKDMVRDMLKNVYYAGGVAYYGSEYDGERVIKYTRPRDIIEGAHIGVVSKARFLYAQDIRQTRHKAPQGEGRAGNAEKGKDKARSASRVYILKGLLDCQRCGRPMHSQAGGGNTRRHLCSTRIQQKDACDQISVKAEVL